MFLFVNENINAFLFSNFIRYLGIQNYNLSKEVRNVTAQIPDEFTFNGESFSLVGLNGDGLFSPTDFNIQPYSRCTACWRGYVMNYVINNDHLVLEGMRVNVKEPPKINGVEPEPGGDLFDYCYKNLNLKTNFTGRMLLAKDFIRSMYVHMGFQRPMAYRTVIEFHVENGDITLQLDFSKKMEEFRNKDIYKDAQASSKSSKAIENWIKQTFSLDYDF